MTEKLIIVGGGGHAAVILDVLSFLPVEVIGLVVKEPNALEKRIGGFPVLGDDGCVVEYDALSVALVNAVGSTQVSPLREEVFSRYKRLGYRFASVISPHSYISSSVRMGEGVQVMAGAVVQPGACLGSNTIVNTGACVDHDCWIGDHVHIAPGTTLSGGVRVESGAHVGAGATVIQNIRVGRNAMVAAGAVVVRDVPSGAFVAGVSARQK